jgi:acetylornithine deacetylase/succinyl-diaminopimelate desuccinylase-like protein
MKFTEEQVAKIKEAAEKYTDDIVTFLRDLIAIPSFSSQEGDCIKRIKEEMEKVGFDEVRIDAIGNVIGTIGSGPKKILFLLHTASLLLLCRKALWVWWGFGMQDHFHRLLPE